MICETCRTVLPDHAVACHTCAVVEEITFVKPLGGVSGSGGGTEFKRNIGGQACAFQLNHPKASEGMGFDEIAEGEAACPDCHPVTINAG